MKVRDPHCSTDDSHGEEENPDGGNESDKNAAITLEKDREKRRQRSKSERCRILSNEAKDCPHDDQENPKKEHERETRRARLWFVFFAYGF